MPILSSKRLVHAIATALGVAAAGTFSTGCSSGNAGGGPASLVGPQELQRPPDPQVVADVEQIHQAVLPAVVPAPRGYLGRMSKRVLAAAGSAYPVLNRDPWNRTQFLLVSDGGVNVSVPGGTYVYVYAGLLAACEREEDLAAALCHALAHLALKHAEATAKLPLDGPAVNPAASPLDKLLYVRFARPDAAAGGFYGPDKHQMAERLAFDVYVKGGWDPQKFVGRDRLARRGAGGMPTAGVTAERAELTTDAETFAEIRAAVAALPPATGKPLEVLDVLPGCYGEQDAPARKAARDALASRARPLVVPETPPIIPQ